MRGVNAPQRLHRDVEGAAAQFREALTFRKQRQQIMGWARETSVAIEACDLAVAAIQAELSLQPFDFGDALGDRALGGAAVRIVEQNVGGGAKRRSPPSMQTRGGLRLVCRRK